MQLTIRPVTFQSEWRKLFPPDSMASFLQRWEWGQVKRRNGWQPIRIGAYRGAELVAGLQMLIQRRRLLPVLPIVGVAYVPRGPIGELDNQITSQLFSAAIAEARAAGTNLLRAEPPADSAAWICPVLAQMGFEWSDQFLQIRHSAHIDLRRPEPEILAGFKSKARYNTRLSARRGVEVRSGGRQDMASFYRLSLETSRRDGFGVHDQGYYQTVFDAFAPEDAALLLARYGEEDLAALMVVRTGREAVYLYGASSSRQRQRMPSFAVQWAAMRWARARGCARYDLWGMTDPDDPNDPMAGVARFKSGFNPQPVEHPGTFDLALSRPLSGIVRAALPLYTQIMAKGWRTEPAAN